MSEREQKEGKRKGRGEKEWKWAKSYENEFYYWAKKGDLVRIRKGESKSEKDIELG